MHDNSPQVRARIARFVSERIEPAVYRDRHPLTIEAWEVPGEPVPFREALVQAYAPFSVGQTWGKPWGTTWFHVTGHAPADWDTTGTRLELLIDLGFTAGQSGFQAEGLVYRPDGSVIKAIEPFNAYVPIDPDGSVDVYVEAASNPDVAEGGFTRPTRMGDTLTSGTDPIYSLRHIDIALLDEQVWQLDREFVALRGLMVELPHRTTRPAEIERALERAIDAMDPHDISGTAAVGRAEIAEVLAKPASASAHRITAIGHAHIDSAWLWPVRETIRKCARTFSNVLQLMDIDPDFKFACSSAQQYAWIKEFYPELFERIRVRVAEGRFIPVGGMWVESDTNLISGESMARQFVAGKGFFQREFGVEPKEVWLPDSFGYSGALPQIVTAAGSQHFLTQKISWNETNSFPHSTFLWEGIDGTRVLTHFPPVNTYNSDLSAKELALSEHNYADKGDANSSLVPFGYGDGGGGPTREMLAAAKLTRSLEGSPTVEIESPQQFFERAGAEYAKPPVWTGELYLEFHRGTYTSQARTKRGNRRSESLLREAELWATTAAVRANADYPSAQLEALWHTVLLQQFHDILPGTSIAWVYRVAEAEYARVADELETIISAAIGALGTAAGEQASFNAGPFEIDGIAPLASGVATQAGSVRLERRGDGFALISDRARFELDGTGRIRSAVDLLTGREAVAPGESAAELQLFRDTPTQWEAWDIDVHYQRHGEVISAVDAVSVVADGTDRVTVRFERSFNSSSLSQEFSLSAGSASLEIATQVDWHERQKLLKLAFPLDVRAERAASEVQYGHIYRATHENTSWDSARFETSAHRWMHVSEPGFGVAIANDSTYGHDVTRHPRNGGGSVTMLRQSLLRAPLFPDPDADQGEHRFRASFTVGAEISDAVREGYRLNVPLRSGPGGAIAPLLTVDNPGVVVEAIKLAEDGSGDVVVRLYESLGTREKARVSFNFSVAAIVETDLLEREQSDPAGLTSSGENVAELTLRPFQLVTLRISRA
ncbi:glycoside hydrolase family 38 C-terminal domain-containing protein [Glaciihabitans sp. UYNi722]|uniref:alpha-mannosidase n=1 Tax=Glaciihabitans sp. UYNi722 TaxID=3156344 RepID=UPI00339209DC